jgi:ribosomal protein S18 acetylase RimI-like enzyme
MNTTFSEAALRRIEEISQNASRPERGVMVDGWSVGLSPSKAKRSRAVNAFYPSVRSFEENLATVRALYARASLPCVFRLSRFVSDATIDSRLAAMGCEAFDRTLVQLCELSPNDDWAYRNKNIILDMVDKLDLSPDSIGRTVQELRGDSDEEIAALVERWKALPLALRSYAAHDANGEAVSHVATIAEDHCVGVFDVVTKATHRGRGIAAALIAHALNDARAHGATLAYLQVMAENPAVRVYERLGFTTAYDYWYRQLPDL